MNGDLVNRKLVQKGGRLSRMLEDPKLGDAALVRQLYLLTFNRPPGNAETSSALAIFADAPGRTIAAQDLFWALLNSKEFLFNH